ncbi:MAG TPA: hypothetical protein VK184_07845 [Nostocaceae cyanobacterium]|nr:hypothetical protein [Nostocaceae cyanobacterium]
MKTLNKHIWKQLITITCAALLSTSCQNNNVPTGSQNAITDKKPNPGKTIKAKPANSQNSIPAKIVKVQPTNSQPKPKNNKPVAAASSKNNEINRIKAIFDQNLKGLNTENLEVSMGVIDPTSPNYEQIKQLTQTLFKTYDINYELNKLEIVEFLGNEAKVKITRTAKKINGLTFRDNIMVSVNTVKKYNNQWKISQTKVEKMSYLN